MNKEHTRLLIQKTFLYTVFVFLFIIQSFIFAQSHQNFHDDLDYTWNVTKNLGNAIIKPSGQDITTFLLGSGAVISACFFDNSIRNYSQSHQNNITGKIAKIDHYFGNYRYTMPIPLLIYAGGLLGKNSDLQHTGLKMSQAIIFTGTITLIIKELTGRSRPYLNESNHHFEPFSFNEDRRSFFSGHSSTTFALSTVLAAEIDNLAWKIFWFGAAGTVAGARIYHDKHWFSDTVAGALVGYTIGNFVSRQGKTRDKKLRMLDDSTSARNENDFIVQFSIPIGF